MGNKEMSDLEKELLDSAAKLDNSKVEPDELEQTAGGFCCGGDCRFVSSSCGWTSICEHDCAWSTPS